MDELTPPEREAYAWRVLMAAMGGTIMYTSMTYEQREDVKTFASMQVRMGERAPALRVGGWLLHALVHWLRAEEAIHTTWPAEVYDDAMPFGLTFRRYLGAWLWAVGVPSLHMKPEDLEAVHEATGVAPLPHRLMPIGCSYFERPDRGA
jgi:hypothetical protein